MPEVAFSEIREAAIAAAAVTAAKADVGADTFKNDVDLSGGVANGNVNGRLWFELENIAGDDALTEFELLVQPHADAAFYVLLAAAEWTETEERVQFLVGTPATLAAGAFAAALVDVGPFHALKWKAKCAAAESTTLNIKMRVGVS